MDGVPAQDADLPELALEGDDRARATMVMGTVLQGGVFKGLSHEN